MECAHSVRQSGTRWNASYTSGGGRGHLQNQNLHTQCGWGWPYCLQGGFGILCMFLNWVDSCFLGTQKKLEAIKGLLLITKGSLNSWMSGVGWYATRAYSSFLILKVWHLQPKNKVLGFILTGRGVNVMF